MGSEDRASIIKGDALKVLPDLNLDDDGDSGGDESKVPLTRSNLYADSPREVQLSDGVSEEEVVYRRRVGIAIFMGLILASTICVLLLGAMGEDENFSATPAIQHHFMAATSADGFKKNLEFYANVTRHTGSNGDREMAEYIRSRAIAFGLEENAIKLDEFEMLVNKPETLTLEVVHQSDGVVNTSDPLAFYDFVADHAARQAKRQAKGKNVTMPYPAFHLYSKNGTASGELVYAHFGSSDDYEALMRNNVSVAGKIVLVRMGGDVPLPAKVVLAAKFGAVGVLTYNDPADDGSVRGHTAPDGPWRPNSSTAFGNVYMGDGDPTMPEGFSATRPMGTNADRLSAEDVYSANNTFNILPPIVSMPISAVVALELLTKIQSTSANVSTIKLLEPADVFGSRWEGGGLGVQYQLPVDTSDNDGSLLSSKVVVKMENHNAYSLATTWNVVITLHGSREPDRHVLMGSPRDSLNAGAASTGSSNAVLLEILRALGTLYKNGWRPYRTLVLASFGGEQFGAVGSSHWIDRYLGFGSSNAGRNVVYLHLNGVVRGAGALHCKASATIRKNIYLMTTTIAQPGKQDFPDVDNFFFDVSSPATSVGSSSGDDDDLGMLPINATFANDDLPEGSDGSVFAYWLAEANKKNPVDAQLELPPMDRYSEGRIPPFLGRLGIPSLELGFDGGYYGVGDTSSDTPAWVSHFADPQFAFHRAVTELYGSILLSFTDAQFLQYDFTELSRELRRGEAFLQDALELEGLSKSVSLARLHDATSAFEEAAISVSHEMAVISSDDFDVNRVREINNRLLRAQRAFLLPSGLSYMPWLKNVLYGISEWDDYRVGLFPVVTQELKRGNAMTVRRELVRLCLTIEAATDILTEAPEEE